jgi:hypothetical protein
MIRPFASRSTQQFFCPVTARPRPMRDHTAYAPLAQDRRANEKKQNDNAES